MEAIQENKISSQSLRLEAELEISQIRWKQVSELLISRYKLAPGQVRLLERRFIERFLAPFDPYWFRNRALSEEDNRLIACICEVHGADLITIKKERTGYFIGIRYQYIQSFKFIPKLGQTRLQPGAGICDPVMKITILGKEISLNHPVQISAWRMLMMLSLMAVYVSVVGGLIYGAAVFLTFLEMPAEGLIAATRNAPMGLALLCFMIGIAGIAGRGVAWIVSRIRRLGS